MAQVKNTLCSDISRDLNEPLIGTAPQVGFWILLEVREAWEAKNLTSNSLPPVAKDWLMDVQTRGMENGLLPRAQFIRQRRRKTDPLTLMTCQDGVLRKHLMDDYDELASIDIYNSDLSICEEISYFVCTHGARDKCCSKYGIPTWQMLDSLSHGRAWQTTHLGGHRYATNVLVLPTGHSYGRVMVDETEEFFKTVEEGSISIKHLRGNSALPKEAQVCECAMVADNGKFVAVTDEELQYQSNGDLKSLPLPKQQAMDVLASCGDEELKRVMVYTPV